MTARTSISRPMLVIASVITAVIAITFAAPSAQAGCCTIGVDNQSNCTFQICFETPAAIRCVDVNLGANTYDIPNCVDVRIAIRDNCGNVHVFPTVVGDCIVVPVPGFCCLRICKVADCRYVIKQIICDPC
ncbi:MAG: hypothetical protein JST22_03050 [Bacteroidetes bacterium]|nr:hypothetical protein [Bacteroidota bacterium]